MLVVAGLVLFKSESERRRKMCVCKLGCVN